MNWKRDVYERGEQKKMKAYEKRIELLKKRIELAPQIGEVILLDDRGKDFYILLGPDDGIDMVREDIIAVAEAEIAGLEWNFGAL